MNIEHAKHFFIHMAKAGAAAGAKAKIIRNDMTALSKSNFIGKTPEEAYEEQARYMAHLFGEHKELLIELFGTASPREIARLTAPKPRSAIQKYDWLQMAIKETSK